MGIIEFLKKTKKEGVVRGGLVRLARLDRPCTIFSNTMKTSFKPSHVTVTKVSKDFKK